MSDNQDVTSVTNDANPRPFNVTIKVKGNIGLVYINDIVHVGIPNINKLVAFTTYYNGAYDKRIDLLFNDKSKMELSYDSQEKWVKMIDALTDLIFEI